MKMRRWWPWWWPLSFCCAALLGATRGMRSGGLLRGCASSPCSNGAICRDDVISGGGGDDVLAVDYGGSDGGGDGGGDGGAPWRCFCVPGYRGETCDLEINECLSRPCQHGAPCVNLVDSYSCLCPSGYSGTNCEISPDACDPRGPCPAPLTTAAAMTAPPPPLPEFPVFSSPSNIPTPTLTTVAPALPPPSGIPAGVHEPGGVLKVFPTEPFPTDGEFLGLPESESGSSAPETTTPPEFHPGKFPVAPEVSTLPALFSRTVGISLGMSHTPGILLGTPATVEERVTEFPTTWPPVQIPEQEEEDVGVWDVEFPTGSVPRTTVSGIVSGVPKETSAFPTENRDRLTGSSVATPRGSMAPRRILENQEFPSGSVGREEKEWEGDVPSLAPAGSFPEDSETTEFPLGVGTEREEVEEGFPGGMPVFPAGTPTVATLEREERGEERSSGFSILSASLLCASILLLLLVSTPWLLHHHRRRRRQGAARGGGAPPPSPRAAHPSPRGSSCLEGCPLSRGVGGSYCPSREEKLGAARLEMWDLMGAPTTERLI